MDAVKKRGRKSTSSDAVKDEICQRIGEGEPLRQICREKGMPAWRTVYDWMEVDPDFAARFARARDIGFDAIAQDTIELIDERPERTLTEHGDKVDPGHVQWQKNRVEQRMKLLAKWDPRRYGDKLAVGGADDLPAMKSEATVTHEPSEAYKRLLGG